MHRRTVVVLALLLAPQVTGPSGARGQALSPVIADSIDTSGHTRLKVFGGLYGAYLGIALPIAAEAEDVGFYTLGLMTGPGIGLGTASGYTHSRSVSTGAAIAISSLTWFGAMQGHLWEAAGDRDEGNANAAAGVLGSLGGFAAGIVVAGAHDFTAGHAASLGAGNWWGMALGYLGAHAGEDATSDDELRGAAIGAASGLALGALTGRNNTHNDVRYLHVGGVLGWLYSAGIVVLEEPAQSGESVTQMAGIVAGTTAGLLMSKYKPWRSRPGLALDHSGRLRAQTFAMAYGAYLATVIPLASDLEWWKEDTKDTFTLAYMHAPLGLLLGTTFFTRNTNVAKADVLAVSGLTWFGAMQGALWASVPEDAETRNVAAASAVGSAAGLVGGVLAAHADLSEAQAAMIGAGNWWGSALGLLYGAAVLGEDAEGGSVATATAVGSAVGAAVGPALGRHMTLAQVRTMHIGGLAGWLFGTGSLLGSSNLGYRGAMAIMAGSTTAGLLMGASIEDQSTTAQNASGLSARPFVERRPGLSGEAHTRVGITVAY